jgi:hypothetical protein
MRRIAIIFLSSVAIVHAGSLVVIKRDIDNEDKNKMLGRAKQLLNISDYTKLPIWHEVADTNVTYRVLYVAQDVKHKFTKTDNDNWSNGNLSAPGKTKLRTYETDNPASNLAAIALEPQQGGE